MREKLRYVLFKFPENLFGKDHLPIRRKFGAYGKEEEQEENGRELLRSLFALQSAGETFFEITR